MSEPKKFNGAHDGGIPPGWDFPEARKAAEEGLDLWLLDSNLRLTAWERVERNFQLIEFARAFRKAMGLKEPEFSDEFQA